MSATFRVGFTSSRLFVDATVDYLDETLRYNLSANWLGEWVAFDVSVVIPIIDRRAWFCESS